VVRKIKFIFEFSIKINHLANYCFTTKQSPEGLMLLCEVALGKMHECYKATNLSASTLPSGTHSTKGCGSTMPNPKGFITFSKYKFNFSFC